MSNLSISEISEQLARIDGLDEEAKAYLHRQIRNWANQGLIVPVGARGYGRTAAALFDETALGKCRIFSVLTDLGFDVSRLRQVNQDLRDSLVGSDWENRPASLKVDGGWTSNGVVADAMEGIRQGETWGFQITLVLDTNGRKRVAGRVTWPETRASPIGSAAFDSKILASVSLSLNDLLAPLLEGKPNDV